LWEKKILRENLKGQEIAGIGDCWVGHIMPEK